MLKRMSKRPPDYAARKDCIKPKQRRGTNVYSVLHKNKQTGSQPEMYNNNNIDSWILRNGGMTAGTYTRW